MSIARHIDFGGERIPYGVVFSARRTVAIAVRPGGDVLVRAPRDIRERELTRILGGRGEWIAARVREARELAPDRRYADGAVHHYLGEPYTLGVERAAHTRVGISDGGLAVGMAEDPTPEQVKAAIDAWLIERARRELPQRLEACWKVFGRPGEVKPPLRVRNMRSRWGSLVARSRMTLNAQLMRASAACIDSVIYHELCHMRVDGHGSDFYRELATYVPDWAGRRAELKGLMRQPICGAGDVGAGAGLAGGDTDDR